MKDTEMEGRGDAEIVPGKPWWQSRTIIGVAATVISALLGLLLKRDVASSEEIGTILAALGTLIGGALAIYGRVKAESKIEVRRATRATPEEIEEARRLRTGGGRGGLNKGYVRPMSLAWLLIGIFCLAAAFMLSGCATVQTARGPRQEWQVTTGAPVEKTGRSVVRFGTGVGIVSGASVFLLPLGFVVGVPCYVVGGPIWETGAWMTGNNTDWTYGGL